MKRAILRTHWLGLATLLTLCAWLAHAAEPVLEEIATGLRVIHGPVSE